MQVSTHALLAACLLLLGSRGADAQVLVCGAAGTVVSAVGTTTCTCPAGTGVITAVVGAVTSTTASVAVTGATTVLYLASAGTATTATTITLVASGTPAATAPQVANLCKDLLPGYTLVAATNTLIASLVAQCTAGSACPGIVGMFNGASLPAGFANTAQLTWTTNNADLKVNSDTAIFASVTIAASGVALSKISCISTGNALNTAGGFICPAGVSGTPGNSLAASLTALTGEVICGTGYGPN